MIVYRKANLDIAESYYDDTAPPPPVDIVRYRSRTSAVEGVQCEPVHTILIDLGLKQDALLRQINATKRNAISRAGREGCQAEVIFEPTDGLLEEFFTFYAAFAATKGLPSANRERLTGLRDAGGLALGRATSADGEVFAWHCYLRTATWGRLQHVASLFRTAADKERISAINRANCLLHWHAMLAFQQRGFAVFDLGGWYSGQTDTALLNINSFKESFGGQITQLWDGDSSHTLRGAVALSTRRLIGRLRGEKG